MRAKRQVKKKYNPKFILDLAMACHEANKEYCEKNGDFSQKSWEDAAEWQKNSAIKGVEFYLDNPETTPEQQHQAWCETKIADGWVFGQEINELEKTHPCLVPYDQLPEFQKMKDVIFQNTIKEEIETYLVDDVLNLDEIPELVSEIRALHSFFTNASFICDYDSIQLYFFYVNKSYKIEFCKTYSKEKSDYWECFFVNCESTYLCKRFSTLDDQLETFELLLEVKNLVIEYLNKKFPIRKKLLRHRIISTK